MTAISDAIASLNAAAAALKADYRAARVLLNQVGRWKDMVAVRLQQTPHGYTQPVDETARFDEVAMATLGGIARKMQCSDSLMTAHPLYVVQEWKEVAVGTVADDLDPELVGGGEYEGVRIAAVCAEDGRELDPDEVAAPDGLEEAGEIRMLSLYGSWRTVTVCLSRGGADDYIRRNRHNHAALRVYVESAHANPEMRALREALIALHPMSVQNHEAIKAFARFDAAFMLRLLSHPDPASTLHYVMFFSRDTSVGTVDKFRALLARADYTTKVPQPSASLVVRVDPPLDRLAVIREALSDSEEDVRIEELRGCLVVLECSTQTLHFADIGDNDV